MGSSVQENVSKKDFMIFKKEITARLDGLEKRISEGIVKKKVVKDPNAPKKASSSYLFFNAENRDKVKKQNPDIKPKDIMKELGKMWKALSEKDKVKYNKMADADKVRYANEMKSYKK